MFHSGCASRTHIYDNSEKAVKAIFVPSLNVKFNILLAMCRALTLA